jgi:glycosyltransferase involved in cell wall biosynthesis
MRKVTTVIAHKDYLDYLPKAVKSSRNQTYPNTLCVIDDGSTCDTQEIIDIVFEDEKPEKVFSMPHNSGTGLLNHNTQLFLMKDNCGPSAARNIGIQFNLEKTDAFMILDSDDQMFLNKIEKFVNNMEEAWESVGVVYADYLIDKGDYIINEFKRPYKKSLLRKECIIHSGSLVNSNVFKKIGLYDESLRVCEDYDLWLRMSEYFIARHIPEPLTLVLDHNQNSTNTVKQEIWQETWLKLKNRYKL